MFILNRYSRDERWKKSLAHGGCEIVADAYHVDGRHDAFALHVAAYFNTQVRQLSVDDEYITYSYGFERALISVEANGCQIDITSRREQKANRTVRLVSKSGEKSAHSANGRFSIGAALQGLVPGLSVGGSGGVSYEKSKGTSAETTESAIFDTYTVRAVAEREWELSGWDDLQGLLRGAVCSGDQALCILMEKKGARKVSVSAKARLSDLIVTRQAGSYLPDDVNRNAVATALVAAAFRESEKRLLSDEDREDFTQTLTLARARIVSVETSDDSDG